MWGAASMSAPAAAAAASCFAESPCLSRIIIDANSHDRPCCQVNRGSTGKGEPFLSQSKIGRHLVATSSRLEVTLFSFLQAAIQLTPDPVSYL